MGGAVVARRVDMLSRCDKPYLARPHLNSCSLCHVQEPSLEPCGAARNDKGLIKPSLTSRRHSLPKASIWEKRRQGLQRLLDSPMMQGDISWRRQRQRVFIKSRIEAYGGTP